MTDTDATCEDMLRHAIGEAFNGFRRTYEAHIQEARNQRDRFERERDIAQAQLKAKVELLERLHLDEAALWSARPT